MATFEFLGGCSAVLVPDNLRSGVTKAHRYEPDVNATYQEMASNPREFRNAEASNSANLGVHRRD